MGARFSRGLRGKLGACWHEMTWHLTVKSKLWELLRNSVSWLGLRELEKARRSNWGDLISPLCRVLGSPLSPAPLEAGAGGGCFWGLELNVGKFFLLTTNIVILQRDNYMLLVLSLSTKTVSSAHCLPRPFSAAGNVARWVGSCPQTSLIPTRCWKWSSWTDRVFGSDSSGGCSRLRAWISRIPAAVYGNEGRSEQWR